MQKISRIVYFVVSWLFVTGVAVQVFLAGMVVVARQWSWDNHIGFGHLLGLPILVMLISAYLGRLPGRMKRLNWLLFAVYILQADVIIFMRDSTPLISAFHPVLALVDIVLGFSLARQAWPLVQQSEEEFVVGSMPEPTTTD